jgi:tellurite resistance protein TehA-like permease
MNFRFYSNAFSHASRHFAAGAFFLGLILIGLGFLIYILRDLFAILFAGIFVLAGIASIVTALRILWMSRKIRKDIFDDSDERRKNVTIHYEERHNM